MWNVKTKVISVIIGATGTISESFRKVVKELQKTAIFGTSSESTKVQ